MLSVKNLSRYHLWQVPIVGMGFGSIRQKTDKAGMMPKGLIERKGKKTQRKRKNKQMLSTAQEAPGTSVEYNKETKKIGCGQRKITIEHQGFFRKNLYQYRRMWIIQNKKSPDF